jgi:hypothetical protein
MESVNVFPPFAMDNLYFNFLKNTLKLPWFRVVQFDNIEINPPPKKIKNPQLQKHLTKVS